MGAWVPGLTDVTCGNTLFAASPSGTFNAGDSFYSLSPQDLAPSVPFRRPAGCRQGLDASTAGAGLRAISPAPAIAGGRQSWPSSEKPYTVRRWRNRCCESSARPVFHRWEQDRFPCRGRSNYRACAGNIHGADTT